MIEREFETRDVWLSSFLYALGIVPTLKQNDREITFVFPASPDLDALIRNYHSNVSMKIGDYVQAAKTLRGKMNNRKYESRPGA